MDAARIEAARQAAKEAPAVGEFIAVLAKIDADGIRALDSSETDVMHDAKVAACLIKFDRERTVAD